MADENLSLGIEFEGVDELLAQVSRVRDGIQSVADVPDTTGLNSLAAAAGETLNALEPLAASYVPTIGGQPELNSLADAAAHASDETKKVGTETAKAGDKVDQSTKKMAGNFRRLGATIRDKFKGIARDALAVASGLLLFKSVEQAFSKLVDTVKQAATEFIEMERAFLRFGAAFGIMGEYTAAAVTDMQAFALSLQRVTGVSDTLIIQTASVIAALGQLTGEGLERATLAALDLSVAVGIDLRTAALALGKAAAGNVSSLSEYGIMIDQTIPKANQFAEALRVIEQGFSGTAVAAAEGFGGTVDKLREAWTDFLTAFGSSLQVFNPVLNVLTRALEKAYEILDDGTTDLLDHTSAVAAARQKLREYREEVELLRATTGRGGYDVTLDIRVDKLAQDVAKARTRLKAALEKVLPQVAITLEKVKGGKAPVIEIERAIAELEGLLADAIAADLPEVATKVRAMLDGLDAAIDVRMEVDEGNVKTQLNAVLALADPKLPVEVSFITPGLDAMVTNARYVLDTLETEVLIPAQVMLDKDAVDLLRKVEVTVETFLATEQTEKDLIALGQGIESLIRDSLTKGFAKTDAQKLLLGINLRELLKPLEERRQGLLDAKEAQEFVEWLSKIPTGAEQAKAELASMRTILMSVLDIRDAPVEDVIKVADMAQDVDNLEALGQRVRTEFDALKAHLSTADINTATVQQLLGLYKQVLAEIESLKAKFGEISDASKGALEESLEASGDIATDAGEKLEGFSEHTKGVISNIAGSITGFFGGALDAILGGAENFSEAMRKIFKKMVADIIKQLAKLAVLSVFKGILGGGPLSFLLPGKISATDTAPTTQFSRLERARAQSQIFAAPVEQRPITQITTPITIEATDGVDVRRQLTRGTMRDEWSRALRRAAL